MLAPLGNLYLFNLSYRKDIGYDNNILHISEGTQVSGIISSDTVWNISGSPYNVTGNILVEENITLFIEPGVVVNFTDAYYIRVDGTLKATGSYGNPIEITAEPNTNYRIRFESTSRNNILNYTEIYNAGIDGSSRTIEITFSQLSVFNCHFYNIAGRGIEYNSPIGTQIFSNNTLDAVQVFFDLNSDDMFYIQNNSFIGLPFYGGATQTFARISSRNSNGQFVIEGNKFINGTESSPSAGDEYLSLSGNDDLNAKPTKIRYNYFEGTDNAISFADFSGVFEITYNDFVNFDPVFDVNRDHKIEVHDNNFINCTQVFDLSGWYTYQNSELHAEQNWWNTTSSSEIDNLIWDYYDDFDLGEVYYIPYLFSPVIETYNAQPPKWSNLQINDTLIEVGDNVNISIEVTDNVEVDNVWIDINGTKYDMTNVVGTDIFYYTFIATKGNRTFNYIIFMNDTSGHLKNCISSLFVVYSEDTPPEILINSPEVNQVYGYIAPRYNITINDISPIDTSWYTLNGGITNYTFTELEGFLNQSAWEQMDDGVITIRFYASDSLGNLGFKDINVIKDTTAPKITINAPTPNQLCGVQAPSFDVNINDAHFHKKWYSLDGGENITFTTETQIDQIEWDKIGNGTVLIKFYANDTLCNENSTQVMVQKDIYLPKIVINSPIPDELFEDIPPSFNVEITDPNLHKMWYSIDGELPKIFAENESISQSLWDAASEGIIVLTFFANDTAGNINSISVNILKDTTTPSIEIISPGSNKIFREIAPAFEISITEVNLISTWYTIDDGMINKSFTGLTGTIDEILWWNMPLGPITIRFYAEDIAGNVGYEDVVVIKDIIKSLSIEIVDQWFSNKEFNITFFLFNETGHGISNASIQLWWDETDVSSNILNLGDGMYFISLDPITVEPGEDPVLLNMTISATGFEDKYFETYLAVDPDILDKESGKIAEAGPLIIITIISTAGGIGIVTGIIAILHKRKKAREVR